MVLKNSFLTVDTLKGCDGLERTQFLPFPLWEAVVVLKELNFNSFNFRKDVMDLERSHF